MLSRLKIFTYCRSCKICMNISRQNSNTDVNIKKGKQDISRLYSLFFNQEIQNCLKLLTHIDEEKVFQFRPVNENVEVPKCYLLTTEEFESKRNQAKQKIDEILQMPPVLLPRKKINKILQEIPGLDGHDLDHSKFVFTDISLNCSSNEERIIVVREPNGTLREAEWDERQRMNQIYFPLNGRELYTPKMFEDENLKSLFERKEYKFILDRACIQFEPNDPEYIKVTTKTYDKVNENKDFEMLHSTRHFGSLTFYLLLHKNIDNMIINNINSDRIDDVFLLVELYNKIHKFTSDGIVNEDLLKSYIATESKIKDQLEMEWQNYKTNIQTLAQESDQKKKEVVN